MKMVYIVEQDEFKTIIKESVYEALEAFQKQKAPLMQRDRCNLIEAAEYLGVSKSQMYKYTSHSDVPYHKFGKRLFFSRKELDDWITRTGKHFKAMDEQVMEHLAFLEKKRRK